MKLREHKNSKKQGDAGLGLAIGWYTSNGYTVCIPLTDSQSYDLVVENGSGLKKVQVKTATAFKHGGWCVDLRTRGGNRSWSGKTTKVSKDQVDTVFVCTDEPSMYLIPSEESEGKSVLSLGTKYEKFKLL